MVDETKRTGLQGREAALVRTDGEQDAISQACGVD